jgi:hypothetical protein
MLVTGVNVSSFGITIHVPPVDSFISYISFASRASNDIGSEKEHFDMKGEP